MRQFIVPILLLLKSWADGGSLGATRWAHDDTTQELMVSVKDSVRQRLAVHWLCVFLYVECASPVLWLVSVFPCLIRIRITYNVLEATRVADLCGEHVVMTAAAMTCVEIQRKKPE